MTTTPHTQPEPPELDVYFTDFKEPRAKAGKYTFRSRQVLKKSNGDTLWEKDSDKLEPVESTYEVRSARFYLDEASIQASYPAHGMSGHFGLVLPHITLRRPTLPWERSMSTQRSTASEAPWMALLLFMVDELPDNPGGEPVLRPVAELIQPDPVKDPGVVGPDLVLGKNVVLDGVEYEGVAEETASSECGTIDVPAEVFTAVVPSEKELHYLVHVRNVMPHKPGVRTVEELAEGDFAVVAANRFPHVEGLYAAHLVSLEGHERHLDPDGIPDGKDRVRLCSLRSWVFTHTLENHLDVPGLFQNLVAPGGLAADPPDAESIENLSLRLPPPDRPGASSGPRSAAVTDASTEEYVRERYRRGFVPVGHLLPSGELSFGWYRGPATPVTAPEIEEDGFPYPPGPDQGGLATTADHALIYEPEYGIFDVSYAAAWTLGRTLALADPGYAGDMVRARRELANRDATLLALSADPVRALADPDAPAGLQALRSLASPGFAQSLLQALARPQAEEPLAARHVSVPLSREEARVRRAEPRIAGLLEAEAARHAAVTAQWVDDLALLKGVPFSYLVPNPLMLPPESLRMFRIDRDWMQALLRGATDIAISTSQDAELAPLLRREVARARSVELPTAGILIRSALVAAWPDDFDLTARLNGTRVSELHRYRPAATILLILFDQAPDAVSIREPGQGIHFGLDVESSKEVISLRRLTKGTEPGEDLGSSLQAWFPSLGGTETVFTRYLREGPGSPRRVLNLLGEGATFVPDLARAVAQAEGFARDDLTPGELALEFINSPIEQRLITIR
ncbi:hypothetical protein QZH56_00345 [Streptomyces olivoreticuli]|uniref:hypothetical protein n=1 Tax=Streptomyces olivoreticuli TaxID=68246 RepID=UPI002657CDD8|nr:hypothetical protein [Streptomyces olivoreticuli]WKK24183.1 hypothetical protein QZH56_00345 [Streptomyces olivoreticuli]